ncbi:MAG: Sec-independent protein translocase protein TatB [Actinomycetota bacterium]|nr:Sec-independent protein translocase protein TatB [Actinomycetota bacterium]
MPSSLGPAEILVILVVALIVLGPKRLPEAGRQVGKAISEIRRWSQDVKYEMNQAFNPEVQVVRDPTPLAEPAPAPSPGDATTPAAVSDGPPDAPSAPQPETEPAPAEQPAAPEPEERASAEDPRP